MASATDEIVASPTIRRRRRRMDALQMTLTFHESKDKDGNSIYVSNDVGVDGAFSIDLGRTVFLFFPGKGKTPPRAIIKPRDFGDDDE